MIDIRTQRHAHTHTQKDPQTASLKMGRLVEREESEESRERERVVLSPYLVFTPISYYPYFPEIIIIIETKRNVLFNLLKREMNFIRGGGHFACMYSAGCEWSEEI